MENKRKHATKYPNKIQMVLKLLVEQGYFNKEKDIINIALLEYFSDKGFFDVVRKIEKSEGT